MTDSIVIIGMEYGRSYHKIGDPSLVEHISMENGMPNRNYWRVPKSVAKELGYEPCGWCPLKKEERREERNKEIQEMRKSGLEGFI